MREEIICAGFGGQGIMLLGKVLAQTALRENKNLTWMPSYGAAIRGGTAFCMVIIADQRIASAYVEKCDTLFIFNQPSWEKFKPRVKTGGLVLLNSTLVKDNQRPRRFKLLKIPFTELAASLGDARVANMVALGAYLKARNIFRRQSVLRVFSEIAPPDKRHLLAINQQALEKGYQV